MPSRPRCKRDRRDHHVGHVYTPIDDGQLTCNAAIDSSRFFTGFAALHGRSREISNVRQAADPPSRQPTASATARFRLMFLTDQQMREHLAVSGPGAFGCDSIRINDLADVPNNQQGTNMGHRTDDPAT
jgi:hypothetical protein